jgi:hypothetical protein
MPRCLSGKRTGSGRDVVVVRDAHARALELVPAALARLAAAAPGRKPSSPRRTSIDVTPATSARRPSRLPEPMARAPDRAAVTVDVKHIKTNLSPSSALRAEPSLLGGTATGSQQRRPNPGCGTCKSDVRSLGTKPIPALPERPTPRSVERRRSPEGADRSQRGGRRLPLARRAVSPARLQRGGGTRPCRLGRRPRSGPLSAGERLCPALGAHDPVVMPAALTRAAPRGRWRRRRADVAPLLFRDKRRELALITKPVWPDGPACLGSSIRNKLSADS